MKRVLRSLAAVVLAVMLLISYAPAAKAASYYSPRYTAPSYSNDYYYSSLNVFYASGYGIPNCTAYAYGRAYEILGHTPNLCHYNAGEWWNWNKRYGFYSYGSTPKVGAIVCWDDWNADDGHVAVVEEVHSDGTILVSESTWGGITFRLRTMAADSSDGYMSYYRFLGYIYITDGSSSASSSSSSSSSGSTSSSRETVRFGSTGTSVTKLQQYLYNLGYLNVAPDGWFGSMTDSALRVYQQANGLPVDGVCGPMTWGVLDSGASVKASASGIGGNTVASAASSATTSSSGSSSSGSSSSNAAAIKPDSMPTISRGSSSTEAVVVLQQVLTALGYNVGGVDGSFGNMTHQAVVAFQQDNNLVVDGIVGSQTWTALKNGKTAYSGVSSVSVSESNTAVPSGLSTGLKASNMPTVRWGSENESVKTLQKLLNAMHYDCGPADGIFGSQTYYAVVAYQADANIVADGIVGQQTWSKILGQ